MPRTHLAPAKPLPLPRGRRPGSGRALRRLVLGWGCLVLLAASACGLPADATGRVTRVHDGDSLVLAQAGGGELEVRLFGIDAPERYQPWSAHARRALKEMLEGRPVRLEIVTVDDYGRTVARVIRASDDLDAGLEMVRSGHAWVYERYTDDPALRAAQVAARETRRGLWGLEPDQRVPPWDWRRRNRTRPAGDDAGR